MARNIPPSIIPRLADGHTTQMCAHAQHDQPLGLLHSVLVTLRIPERLPVGGFGLLDFVLSSMPDEHRLPSPFDDDVLSHRDVGQVDFDLGKGKDISGCRHGFEEFGDAGFSCGGGEDTHAADDEVGERAVVVGVWCTVSAKVGNFWCISGYSGGVEKASGGRGYCDVLVLALAAPRHILTSTDHWQTSWRQDPSMISKHLQPIEVEHPNEVLLLHGRDHGRQQVPSPRD